MDMKLTELDLIINTVLENMKKEYDLKYRDLISLEMMRDRIREEALMHHSYFNNISEEQRIDDSFMVTFQEGTIIRKNNQIQKPMIILPSKLYDSWTAEED